MTTTIAEPNDVIETIRRLLPPEIRKECSDLVGELAGTRLTLVPIVAWTAEQIRWGLVTLNVDTPAELFEILEPRVGGGVRARAVPAVAATSAPWGSSSPRTLPKSAKAWGISGPRGSPACETTVNTPGPTPLAGCAHRGVTKRGSQTTLDGSIGSRACPTSRFAP